MLNIIYEDDYLVGLDKPPGLVVDNSDSQSGETLENLLKAEFKNLPIRSGIVHRLDKDTSGVILISKTTEALENLQAQFKDRKTKKEYLALVHGVVDKGGVIEGNIGRNPKAREKFMVISNAVSSGKEAVTEYEPVKQLTIDNGQLTSIFSEFNKIQMRKLFTIHYSLFTLLTCKPLTGRTHQIRVHLKYIGHPIVSDSVYSGRKVYRLDHRWCPRQFLHAQKIGFYHPKSNEWMEVESKLPEDLQVVLETLEQ